eukprot:CAMPEP_0202857802 /NCGR_PEP_ID=MMETSP1391-20130828/601_1 /ASSEMBLY_ACC=CAM_ASM_000867 /TAXON_ID=1034604 /ORGANISM="Chlamydomonas leiostraca, Strain SAG 11-49" /LENGTH=312 /DNA_ID=CAMNT_0049536653 /DNA_START=76 /DNA_END=1014 /DNA_ORIENTATION=-
MASGTVAPNAAPDGVLPQEGMWQAVLRTYDAAQASGAATMTQTQVELVPDQATGVTFVVRLAPSLRAKPKAPAQASSEGSSGQPAAAPAWRNPFLPPEPELTVGHLSPTHTLVLNKFNVVPHHCLVVTRQFEAQTDPLNARDLHGALRVLRAMPAGGLAFYNCGEHSGRSQPHKHMQVVPLPLIDGGAAEPPVQPLIEAAASAAGAQPYQVFEVRGMPCQSYAAQLPEGSTPQQVAGAYDALMARIPQGASYNALLTRTAIMLCPRRAESSGPCAINSLGFAGTILVKSGEEAAYVRQAGPSAILAAVGQPW